jgi:hypothetical protein
MGPMGWTSTVVDHRALAPFAPFGQVGMARVDRAARCRRANEGSTVTWSTVPMLNGSSCVTNFRDNMSRRSEAKPRYL